MQKIAILTDSGCDLSKEILKKYNINLIPFRIIYKEKEYLDRLEISPDEVYSKLSEEIPTTSLPDMEYANNLLCKLKDEGYTHIISINISSALSGTYNSLRFVLENHPELTSYIFDTKTLSMMEGNTVLEAAKMVQKGCSYEDIVAALPKIQEKMTGFFTLDTLEYLKKGGRIGKVAGTIAELLNLKPIISVGEDGSYYTYSKARGRKQALSKLKQIVENFSSKGKCKICVLEGGAREDGEKMQEILSSYSNIEECRLEKIGPALGVHTGPGLIGVCIEKGF
ncbi:DegV family protein [Clostridium fallax]|uniref:EDD domain protein, DegV family n=1 Tax=Clostridium fallax TaxID=1533 RepID=A0A1M4TC25_9CLOT|nr:DegV family protein [Clostridium fallax]SHE41924.1 EDD domain protein, DegV family [Clostridium fallax]SQB22691.1 DegV family protein [Clostridium fallax]